MRMKTLLCAVVLSLLPMFAVAQTSSRIDGAKTPELIPDAVAYRMTFRRLAATETRSTLDQKLARVHFSNPADVIAIKKVIADYTAEAALASRKETLGLTERYRTIILPGTLTQEGDREFDAFVQLEKKHISIQKAVQP